jgi:1-deoxy-D-xylulose-5-phosphate synthase
MSPLHLAQLRSPKELHGRTSEELEALCVEMRAALVEKVVNTGGHLGSNLGVIELTVALHHTFDFLRDKLVFDVSHQCYPHKMLTGRYHRFATLRQTDGMSGFACRKESPYDVLTAGHAGTAISFAAGLAAGMVGSGSAKEGDPWAVAFVGDAGFGAGVSFEGLTHAADRKARLLVILNDNEWSIARSVGALARYLSRIRSSRTLQRTYDRLKSLAHSLPIVGSRMEEVGEVIRHVLIPGHVFEELGVNYIGPLDGHDVAGITDALERAKRMEGVTLLHFLTEKGRGFAPAGDDPERAHGISPPDAKVPAPRLVVEAAPEAAPRRSYTKVFGEALCAAAEKDVRIHAITAAMPSGTGLGEFSQRFPQRFHDTGITEQHAVALAGGLATVGKRPVVAIYSTFLQRGYDQVFQEVALQEEDVLFCLDRAGLVGQDGPTHMGLYDMAYLRPFPGMVLASPRDAVDLERLLQKSLASRGPWALRWPRGTTPDEVGSPASLRPQMEIGTAELLRSGHHGAVFALGAMVEIALDAANQLKANTGLEMEVYDARFCKPLDREAILSAATKFGWLATVEEHAAIGGFGSAVAELLADHSSMKTNLVPCRLLRHAVPDRFIDHMNSRAEQLVACRLDASSLADAWAESLQTSNLQVSAP